MHDRTDFYAGGRWQPSAASALIDVRNPATGDRVCGVSAGDAADVGIAIAAASAAAADWSATPIAERIDLVARLRDRFAAQGEELADLITLQMGCPTSFSRAAQIGLPLRTFDVTLAAARELGTEIIGRSVVHRDPVGVIAAITPWNFPLHQIAAKVVPALLAGCPVVLKPSEITPLDALLFAQLVDECGFPPGVFNLVLGDGVPGAALSAHPDIAMVSFTGSTSTGRQIAASAGSGLKKVALELGGKSANILLSDVDIAAVVPQALGQCFVNAGQTCAALTRLLVPGDRLDAVVSIARAALADWQPADPGLAGTRLGPLSSLAHRDRVSGFLSRAAADGAEIIRDPLAVAACDRPGAWFAPALVIGAAPTAEVVREEIFGPVLTIQSYTDENDAVRIANDSAYGLSGGVWSEDQPHAEAVAARLRTGQVILNGAMLDMEAPFGGVGCSGLGREYGRYGLEEFFSLKAITRPAA